ncbi:MAG: hypothetical protein LUC38_02115 [Oscillospiraceae bacterium]|nr:hypothetical protein [Oscillospiraceae bacterium]
MKRILLILTCLAILLTLAGCAGVNVSDFVETNYSDSHETEAKEPVSEVSNPLMNASLTDCTVTVTRMFDVQALNDPITLEGDELTDFISAYKNAEIGVEPVELEDFDPDSIVTHYTITLSDGSEIKLSSYDEYIVINGELFTIDEESLDAIESYFLEIYAEDYKLHELCYAEYKLQTGEWTENCYNQVRYTIPRKSFYIENPNGAYFSTGDWGERTAREQAELDEILAGIDDIMPYVLKDDGTVNEDRYVEEYEMLPYKIDESVNPLLTDDFEGCTVYIERDYEYDDVVVTDSDGESVYVESTNFITGPVQMDEETAEEFLSILMSLEMDETPTVDDNIYEGGVSDACYRIVLSDGSEYRVYFMSVSAPVGNNLYGSAQYIVVGGYKYRVTNDNVYDLFDELESFYYAQYMVDTELYEFSGIIEACANVAPGTAGSSLRSVSAAASLLDWAEDQLKYIITERSIISLLKGWQSTCEDFDWQLECLKESWESVVGSIEEIVADPTEESLSGLLDDSGYTLKHDEYDEEIAEIIISAVENFIAD